MTAKEKVEELIKKFQHIEFPDGYRGLTEYEAIYCAIITVDEVLEIHPNTLLDEQEEYKFWEQVKEELTNKSI